jgi:hypothetical protein
MVVALVVQVQVAMYYESFLTDGDGSILVEWLGNML